MSARAALAAVSLLILGGCDALVSNSRYTEVVVEATRRDGTPVPGAPLVLYTGQRPMGYESTDASGRAVFEYVPAGPGYGVFAQAPDGYAFPEWLLGGPSTEVVQFALHPDSVPVVRFTFLKIGPGAVRVQVTDDSGAPLEGMRVQLIVAPGRHVSESVTSSAGSVTFADLPYGNYAAVLERTSEFLTPGEEPWLFLEGLVVEEGVTATATAVLTRTSAEAGST